MPFLSKKEYFFSRGHFRSFAEEDRGLDLKDPSSSALALVDCVITEAFLETLSI